MILVLGATGATGRLLCQELLQRGHDVRMIVRDANNLPAAIRDDDRTDVIEHTVLDMNDEELAQCLDGCEAVASCLGHQLSFWGIFGQPRRLVTDSVRRVCSGVSATRSREPVKIVLMNSAGVRNHGTSETISVAQRFATGLLRVIVPPHADNEDAAEFLRTESQQVGTPVEWAAVRPDTLINESTVSDYVVHPSPTRSAIFDPGRTSRINVAHFMADLITTADTWQSWKGKMPVIYNVPAES